MPIESEIIESNHDPLRGKILVLRVPVAELWDRNQRSEVAAAIGAAVMAAIKPKMPAKHDDA